MGAGEMTDLRRARLIDPLLVARVGVIEAPSGYGKTTLARQLATARESAFVELALTSPTTGPLLRAAIADGCRRAGHALLAEALRQSDGDDIDDIDDFVAAMTGWGEPLTVMIDEMQLLQPDTVGLLAGLATRLPARSGVVLIGRRLPDAVRPLVRQPNTVTMGLADLRMTADDVARLLRAAGPGEPRANSSEDEELIAEVLDITDGWPAAIAVAVAAVAAGGRLSHDDRGSSLPVDFAEPSVHRIGRTVMARLVDDLLAASSVDQAADIAAMAHAPLIDADVAAAIAGPSALRDLIDSGIPLVSRADGWYEMPDPVRDELIGRNGIGVEARRGAATVYARRGLLPVAVRLLQSADDLSGLATLLTGLHWSALEDFGPVAVRLTVGALDAANVAPPMLLVDAARALELREPQQRTEWLRRAVELATTADDTPALLAAIAEQARDLVRRGDRDAAKALAGRVVESTVATITADTRASANARGRALWVLGVRSTLIATPTELAAATDWFEDAVALFRSTGEWRWEADALLRLGYNVSFHWGRFERAVDQVGTALALLPQANRDRAIGLTYYADVLDAAGRSEEGAAAAQESAALGRRMGDPFVIGCAAWSAMWIAAHRGDLAATRRWLVEVDRNPGRWLDEATGAEFLLAASDALAMMGDEDGCREYLARGTAVVDALAIADVLAPAQARYEASFGDPVEAERILLALEGAPFAVERARWIRLAMRALAAYRRGDTALARDLIGQSDVEATSIGIRDSLATHEPWIARQLATILSPQMLKAAGSSGVRVQLLGAFAVTDGAVDVTPPPGRASLVVKLVATRGTITNDEVIDILWPEADIAAGRARLRNLLSRLRINSRDIVARQGESLTLAAGIDVDATRFEALAAAALGARQAERIGLARHALTLYSGELLPGDRYEDWVIALRERLRRRYLALADLVAHDAVERGDLDDAIHLFDAAIAAEPMDESRYVEAASVLIRQGRRGTARDLVERAVRLADDLGLRSSTELVALQSELDQPS
ncbi:MAG: hypothetical protein JWL72_1329 [Ilumatobacteraceae bacterium]|nr:hypothetical protein [Ilumatobacteraceae bacterium]